VLVDLPVLVGQVLMIELLPARRLQLHGVLLGLHSLQLAKLLLVLQFFFEGPFVK